MAPVVHRDVDACVDAILERVGRRVVLGMPLGVGKPNHLVNGLFAWAVRNPSLELTILTALSLDVPPAYDELERRLLGPIHARIHRGYPGLAYVRAQALPPNVIVREFFLRPGQQLADSAAQCDFVCSSYTHVARDAVAAGVNVFAQLVSPPRRDPRGNLRYNLGTNPDVTLDLLRLAADAGRSVLCVAQTNRFMPWLSGASEVDESLFHMVLDDDELGFELFSVPNHPLDDVDLAIGLHASTLVADGGTLQLGIGAMADAVSAMLLLRQTNNPAYRTLVELAGIESERQHPGGIGPFAEGLYALTEMFSEGLLELYRAGVLRRRVRDGDAEAVLHAGFVLGSRRFYRSLRELPATDAALLRMAPISFVNALDRSAGAERMRADRRRARFFNSGLVATLLGDVASDTLADGRVVGGVGGQHDFVAMAHALPDARSILMVRSVREGSHGLESNLCWSYARTTIPRYLRDIIVTEYGIADLRGRSDAEVVARMLAVADSRFQPQLLTRAKRAGKIAPSFEIPERWRNNTPDRVAAMLRGADGVRAVARFPFGTELTPLEDELARGLRALQRELGRGVRWPDWRSIRDAWIVPDSASAHLRRMGLLDADDLRERALRRALVYGLSLAGVLDECHGPPTSKGTTSS